MEDRLDLEGQAAHRGDHAPPKGSAQSRENGNGQRRHCALTVTERDRQDVSKGGGRGGDGGTFGGRGRKGGTGGDAGLGGNLGLRGGLEGGACDVATQMQYSNVEEHFFCM